MNEAELKDLLIEQMIENRKLTKMLEEVTRPGAKVVQPTKPKAVHRESNLPEKSQFKPTRAQLKATKHHRNNVVRNREIMRRAKAGESLSKIGKAYGLTYNGVWNIVRANAGGVEALRG